MRAEWRRGRRRSSDRREPGVRVGIAANGSRALQVEHHTLRVTHNITRYASHITSHDKVSRVYRTCSFIAVAYTTLGLTDAAACDTANAACIATNIVRLKASVKVGDLRTGTAAIFKAI